MKRSDRPDFYEHYGRLFEERWAGLLAALREPPAPLAWSEGLLKPYYLDAASILAARLLGPVGGGRLLDLCAAPGGKTLVMAAGLGPGGSITANERSRPRRERLRRVLAEHLADERRALVKVTGHDAARWGLYEQEGYDLVLLDAPCSSERHLARDARRIEEWSPSRSKRLAQQAYAMLLSAAAAVRPGGLILYCTCALSPLENDPVVERALARFPGALAAIEPDWPGDAPLDALEAEGRGHRLWPDRAGGAGPLFFCLLRKTGATPLA